MKDNAQFSDIFSNTYIKRGTHVLRHLVVLAALMTLGSTGAWAQTDYSGYYYISGNNQGTDSYVLNDRVNNYYLCPTVNWIYYDAEAANKFTNNNNGQPFLTSYQYRNGVNDSTEAVWHIVKHAELNYYYIIHEKTGKYLASNAGLGAGSNANRLRVHLETVATPPPADDRFLFTITKPSYYNISPKGNSGWYLNITQGNYNSLQGASSSKNDGPTGYKNVGGTLGLWNSATDYTSKWYFEEAFLKFPSITINAAGDVEISTTEADATIYYTTDGSDPEVSATKQAYSGAITPTASMTVIKARVIHNSNGRRSEVATQPIYTYHIVNLDKEVAIKCTVAQEAGVRFSGYASIPAAIRSPYLNGEALTFYSFTGAYSSSSLTDANKITETPASSANIYVTYTNTHLMSKFLHLRAQRTFNVTINGDYVYDNSGTLAHNDNPSDAEKESDAYLWYIGGKNDPYAVEIKNKATNNYLKFTTSPTTLSLADTASDFILLSGSAAGDGANYEQMELMAATGDFNYYRVGRTGDAFSISTTATGDASLQVRAYPVGAGVNYYLIDRAGKLLTEINSKSTALGLPDAWKSPLVNTYHYYSTSGYNAETEIYTPSDPIDSPEIDPAVTPNIYVTYEANNNIRFYDPDGEAVGITYMLKFYGGESFYQENGKDGLMTTTEQAVYPYANGDVMLYVYGEPHQKSQFNSGASTRPRWLWYVESPNNDPYRVKILSNKTEKLNGSDNSTNIYFRTYAVEYGGSTHIVTNLTTNHEDVDKDHANLLPTEYMILSAPNNRYKLVTLEEINGEHRTVTSFEQYWKNNPTVQNQLGGAKVTNSESNSSSSTDDIILEGDKLTTLTNAQPQWHTYKIFANAAPWVKWTEDDTSGKKYLNRHHWFQTIDMGTGEFTFEETSLEPQVILLDQHGWEIMRAPLSDVATLRKYDSPMVDEYQWYPTAAKVAGYHKYTVSDPAITVYSSYEDGGKTKWRDSGDDYTHTSKTLTDSPYDHINPTAHAGWEEQPSSVKTDFYVTYTVKPEYTRLYTGAATAGATSASSVMLKQGDKFAKIDGTSLSTEESVSSDLESIPTELEWYMKPNFDIDAEMGYKYRGEPGAQVDAQSKSETEAAYHSEGKNGFDPYNVQIQSVANTSYYFKTTTSGSHLDGGAWEGTSSDLGLNTMSTGQQEDIEGYDQTTLNVTNATFMVVNDGSGHMLLMPRFDHTKVVNSFTDTKLTSQAAATNYLTITLKPTVIHSSDDITLMTGNYIFASGFTLADGFESIGSSSNPFRGSIDGNYQTISNLSVPLLAYADGAIVKNIILDNVNITTDGNVGAIASNAMGDTRIYNCGILSGSVGGEEKVGGIVGLLDGNARVINCFSYANITGGSDKGGIVGYNNFKSTAANIKTMVMNCMFYGDIASGGNVSPIYGGEIIDNLHGGLNNYNYYAYDKLKTGTINKYNNALAVELKYLNRFEFYRQLLNSNRRLAAYYASSPNATVNAEDMMKWVLETADKSNATPKPYPVLKEQAYYPSIINYDTRNLESYSEEHRNEGRKIGTLSVTIKAPSEWTNAPGDAKLLNEDGSERATARTISLVRTDKDFDHFNYNYDKVQLPYYNDYGTKNYTGNKVVTGWKITNITDVAGDPYTSSNYDYSQTYSATPDYFDYPNYNFADRKSSQKDLYSVSGRVFSQGAYFDVPYGVTSITIEPYWGNAAYVADEYLDVVYNSNYEAPKAGAGVTQLGKQFPTSKITIDGSEQTVHTSISNALNALGSATVYDNAVVLVGNLHQNGVPSNGSKPFTIMSADLDHDNEPDYSMIYHHSDRQQVSPIRFDFINIPGTAQAQKPNGTQKLQNFTIFLMKGWFETTNTCIVYSNQVEYENKQKSTTKVKAPLILLGGDFEQFVSTRAETVDGKTIYIHVGSNVKIDNFGVGTHGDGNKGTPHIPVSVTGGEYKGFYLTGTYNPNAAEMTDNAECYISGGHFVEAAGACQEPINGNVYWQIYDADIDAFYGGGINDARPIKGTITTDIFNSHVTTFCGGPKFGNMTAGKAVTTNAEGCVFDQYFGAGYGGLSYSRQKYIDESGFKFGSNPYTTDKELYFDGQTTNANNSHPDYGKKGPGVATDFDYEFFVWSTGVTGARMYVKFASFSLAQCDNVFSNLKGCTVNKNFYGGGSLGKVTGTATSVLENCTVNGNVFGGGYSGTLPSLEVRDGGFTKIPQFNNNSGLFEAGEFSGTTTYTWKNAAEAGVTLTNGGDGSDKTNHYIYTNQDLTKLGQVGHTDLTIKGTTKVSGIVEGETVGGVFGGGDMSAVNGDTEVKIQATDATVGVVNVYGGGNTANVVGTATVTMTGGKVSEDIYGGGKGQTTEVAGDVTVDISAGTVSRNVYGGSALGTVHAAAVTLSGGTVSGSVYGGGLGQTSPSSIAAQNLENATVSVTGGTVGTAVYGGSNANGVLKKDATVTITGGTVGTAPGGDDPLTNAVFGGGYGEPTLVEGNVTVNIGTKSDAEPPVYTGTAIINGHVYGGGALGNVNTSKPGSDLVFDATKKVDVNLYAGTINGNVYGGGLGRQAVVGPPAVSAVEAYVGGDVTVKLDGAAFHLSTTTLKDDEGNDVTAFTSGQIFGGNNLNGTPKGHVLVHVKRTVAEAGHDADSYYLGAVYGGGNEANYNPTDAKQYAEVVIEGCDVTRIKDVYAGGNAAAAPATEVWILACKKIENVFGGGNGELGPSHAAHVGFHREADLSKSDYASGTGKAFVNLIGGTITNVYGGSNSNGDIRGGSHIQMPQQSEYSGTAVLNSPEKCTLHTTNIYGGGKNADMSGGTSIVLGCMPDAWIEDIYAGAQNADVEGDVNLTITSGKFYRVFGGNKDGGMLKGSITVNIEETGSCDVPIVIGELYGGGNLAGYSIYGYDGSGNPRTKAAYDALSVEDKAKPENRKYDNPEVNVRAFTSIGKIFGGGYQALMIADPHVDINVVPGSKAATARAEETINDVPIKKKNESTGAIEDATITLHLPAHEADKIGAIEYVFGGGNLATVDGNTEVNINTETTVDFITEPAHLGTKGTDYTYDEGTGLYRATVEGAIITGSVYGGGNEANITGNTQVNICAKYDETASEYRRVAPGTAGVTIANDVFGAGKGVETDATVALVSGNTTIVMMDGDVKKSVYGGGELSQVAGNTNITVNGGTIGTSGQGGETYGNVYGGGKGNVNSKGGTITDATLVAAGLIKGNTNITIGDLVATATNASYYGVDEGAVVSTPHILHNIYGGGAHGSVGTFTYDASYVITGCTSGGTATINITGGTIGTNGYNNGMVYGSSRGDIDRPGTVHDKVAWVNDTHVNIGTPGAATGPRVWGSVYGSGENGHTNNNAEVTIYSGTIGDPSEFYAYRGNVYGGGCGTDKYYVNSADETHDGNGTMYNHMAGIVKVNATVTINGGSVANNIYGAGSMGKVGGNASVTINTNGSVGVDGTNDDGNVYGAARGELNLDDDYDYSSVTNSSVTITKGTIKGNVFGGGKAGPVKGAVSVTLNGGTVQHDVYGGGALANTNTDNWVTDHLVYTDEEVTGLTAGTSPVDGYFTRSGSEGAYTYTPASGKAVAETTYYRILKATNVTITDGTINGKVYGGGLGQTSPSPIAANVYSPVIVKMSGGHVTDVFGCNNINGAPHTAATVIISGGTVTNNIYGGGNVAAFTGNTNVTISDGTAVDVYGGGLGATAVVTGDTRVAISGGTIGNDVYGGGSQADVTGNVSVSVSGGKVVNDVYGGGALANTNTANWNGDGSIQYVLLTVKADPTADEIAAGVLKTDVTPVAGYFTEAAGVYTRITNPEAKANGATYYYKKAVTGTWADGKTSASNTTSVSLTGGLIGNAYGGGLGNSTTMANVYGDVTVNVNKDVIESTKGIVFNQQIEHPVIDGTDYPTPVKGRVFGCNNHNGTPTGEVTVHVYSTRQIRKDTEDEILPGHGSSDRKFSYDIQSVYGGGNQADYLPAAGKKSHVIIEGCDETSIEKVYGGCNSAVIPETDVLIKGCYDIGYGFGGGNGGRPIKKEDGNWYENEGAIVIGTARIECQGGKIGQVFGGGDSKGSCGSTAPVIPEQGTGTCPLWITRLYGAGNAGDVSHVNIIIAACSGNAIEYVHGGSYNAHVHDDINLTITSGILKNVYGGNDSEGGIEGDITVNIEETDGCNPIIIQNLVGGGNEAAYPGTLKSGGVETPINRHGKITVNVKSATRIDNIYGGGFNAESNADTEININMMKGSKAGETVEIPKEFSYIPNISGISEVDSKTIRCTIDDAIGTIGNVYGGGKEGLVKGNTQVNINSSAKVYIMKRNGAGKVLDTSGNTIDIASGQNIPAGITIDCTDEHDTEGAHITGNVFGGGENADVTSNETYGKIGNAEVYICANKTGEGTYASVAEGAGKVTISNGSVYGGGSAADVHGNTYVTMSGGYVFNGIFGGGYSGSVGTYTTSTEAADVNIFGHTDHAGCIGKPMTCTSGGKCTVVVDGGQIGPVEVATEGMPNPYGWVWGGGCGVIDDPAENPDTHFKTYVNETDVTIGGTAFIMEGIIGGGEFGRVLGNTLVKIQDHCQIGVGEGMAAAGKPVRYTDGYNYGSGVTTNQFIDPTVTAVTAENALADCAHWDFKSPFLPYDPYYDEYSSPDEYSPASTAHPSDGKTWIGVVFGGGSGYMPYKKAGGSGYDWCRSAGWVEGDTEVRISGGHILTNVYGGNENTDVKGKCTVKMSGGTLGLPRTLKQIAENPLTGYLFGAGKGDQRSHFDTYNKVGSVEVEVSGGIIYGSVFGGAEDGHVLGDVKVDIKPGAKIGTWGTSYVDGNVFGGGRGFSGTSLTAGSVEGNVTVNISGGTILGSVYGGGRMASVGIDFLDTGTPAYGQLLDDDGDNTYGHITIDISGGTIGGGRDGSASDLAANYYDMRHSGNVFGGCMGRLTQLDGITINSLWPKMAVAKTTTINVRNSADIKRNVYGGSEYGIVRNQATVNVAGGTVRGSVFGGGYGSDDNETKTTITPAGYAGTYYTFTPMLWAGCVAGNTTVNISGGEVKDRVYGGGELASVGLIDFVSDASGNFTNMPKHESLTDGFGLSWPYKFTYHAADPKDPTKDGKATVHITGGTIGTMDGSNYVDDSGYIFGGCKGKVSFGATDDIEQQRYTEAFIANVRETEVIIGTKGVTDNSTPQIRTAYGGGEDGHVIDSAKVIVHHGTINRSIFGGGKGSSLYTTTLLDSASPGNPKGSPESVHSWTAGKVYGNTSVTMYGGTVGWFIFGGGNMASVGKGNYSGGSDDYSTAGYGETLSGSLWTNTDFTGSGNCTVNIYGGTVGTSSAGVHPTYGVPYGSIFGGSRGQTAKNVDDLSPRYKYVPDSYVGYVNKATINIGGTSTSDLAEGDGPNIYGSLYGGGQDGHVRNSTEVKIFKGNIIKQTGNGADRSGNVFGAGSGIGTYTDGVNAYCSSSSGSVTCTTLVEVNGGSIAGNVYGGGALASVGPTLIGTKYEQKAASGDRASYSHNTVNIKGGSIGGSVFGASRGPSDIMFTGDNHPFTGVITAEENPNEHPEKYNPSTYATCIWTEVNVTGGTIGNNVYGGGEMGQVKESTEVNLKGGTVTHDAYGGGQGTRGTNAIAADVGGNTTVKLNEGVAEDEKGCVVDKIFGCNDLYGTPKGHVLVHVYATQKDGKENVLHKVAPPTYTAVRGTTGYKEYLDNLITEAKKTGGLAADATVITTAENLLNTTLAAVAEDDLTTDQQTSITTAANDIIAALEALHDYDVTAVYGGGDLAPYEPAVSEDKTEVIIEGCNTTSIKQVYGGGNAASVPATDVLVKSCFIIDELFGGGNGLDNYSIDGKWYENPGANVGYTKTEHHVTSNDPGYNSVTHGTGADETNKYIAFVNTDPDASTKESRQAHYRYGTGVASTIVNGGHIHSVYGGSNKKGNISGEIRSQLQQVGSCPMLTDYIYGGSKNAETDAVITEILDCVDNNDKPGTIYGGSYNADINSDINIHITNGTYDKIFGGNDRAGTVNGKITITIEEYGCTPIRINELYAGGNLAPYSVYGFKTETQNAKDADGNDLHVDNDPAKAIVTQRIPYRAGEVGARTTPYWDPRINIISATEIGKIFGGGYGAGATLIGNPHINVNMTEGKIRSKYNDFKPEYAELYPTYDGTGEDKNRVIPIGTIGSIYGGGNLASVEGDTYVEIGTGQWISSWDANGDPVWESITRNAATITGNVFGGGMGVAEATGSTAFTCSKGMVGAEDENSDNPDGGTSVIIANGTVGTLNAGKLVAGTGNVYGGGEVGRVQKNTAVTIGVTPKEGETKDNTKFKPTVYGSVFGAGKGVDTHGFSALVMGNSTVTIQGFAKVGESVYGGGEVASVGRYNLDSDGMPTSLVSETSGNCIVTVIDNAEIGPNNMTMFHVDGSGNIVADDQPDNSGHVFGAGKGAMPVADYATAQHMTNENTMVTGFDTEELYLKYIETLGLATQTEVTIGGNAFVKGDIFGGAEQGFVQHDTHVIIEGNCQIGNGYVQMNAAGEYLARTARYSLNRRYTDEEWSAGKLTGVAGYENSLPECASWEYGQAAGTSKYALHDMYANSYDSKGGSTIADNGSTFYGNVFGGGSGYFPYAPGKWHWKAGDVGGNTLVEIKGGHILTNVYGGNELTNVAGKCTVRMSGGTIGVPRTLGQIAAHPVTCYLFGGGKGDPRVLFNKETNVQDVEVNVNGGWIYGSVFGGGEDGHVMRDVTMNIQNTVDDSDPENPVTISPKIGTWGTSYVDGNVFGGGRGFAGDAYTAGNVAGSITLNISGGTMLGSIYGGGRLGSVGYGLYAPTEIETGGHKMYGEMQDDGYGDWYKNSSDEYVRDAIANFKRGYVTINISGGTIGNKWEFIVPSGVGPVSGNAFGSWTDADWTSWKNTNHVPYTEYDKSNGRLTHTKGGNVFAGGMGRHTQLDGETEITAVDWWKLGNVKSTTLTISGTPWIMSNVYGGGEMGAVNPYTSSGEPAVKEGGTTSITITGGTIGTEVTGATPEKTTVSWDPTSARSAVQYTFGSVYGGGMGMEVPASGDRHGGEVGGNATVSMSGADTEVRASVFGGGEMAIVDGNTTVTVSGGKIGRNEVKPLSDKTDPNAGYVLFGSATMGNVYGGGKGLLGHTLAGLVKGNTNVNITGGEIYHMVYGGGALGSVGTFSLSNGKDAPAYIPIAGIPYDWKYTDGTVIDPANPDPQKTPTGTATVTITGGTIGISGRDNGLVFGSSRGDLTEPTGSPAVDPYDRVAWVNKSIVNIGTENTSVTSDDYLTKPLIKGSVYGGGENGHNNESATVNVYSGTIGVTNTGDPYYNFDGNDAATADAQIYRGNVYGAGSGSDTYKIDGVDFWNPKSGMVAGNTFVNIYGGHIGRSVYGGGAMASVGTIMNATDTVGVAKHASEATGFALSWPYKFEFAPNTGKATVNVTGGHIGTRQLDGGDVYGSSRGKAGDRYKMAHLAWTNETEVNINYSSTEDMPTEEAIQNDFTKQCISGSVHGSGEDGYVYGDTHVTLNKGLIGHSLYGGGKGKGTYEVTLRKVGGEAGDTYPTEIYSLIAGRVMGNTYVTMNDGRVGRNVYGGGNMASVGKGNYASGPDDYYPDGYGEKIDGNLWTSSIDGDYAWEFLHSGNTDVKVFGGTVGYIDATDPSKSMKYNLPYGNVIGGSAGEPAPNVPEGLLPRYHYCPAFFSGYVNETDVTIGGYRCKTAYSTYKVGDCITATAYDALASVDKANWEAVGPRIYASVYGGGQDGHVRRDTKVTVDGGEIGMAYNAANQGTLKTADLDSPQWLHRGNIYGGGSGISPYTSTLAYKDGYEGDKVPATGYSPSSGSVSRFTEVNVKGGTIHRNVYGGGSLGSVGVPDMGQGYYLYRRGQANIDGKPVNGPGRQSMNTVNIGGGASTATIGTPTDYQAHYGGEVYGACRGNSDLDANQFATSVWTQVNILNRVKIMGNVFGGGDNGMVQMDTDVRIGE